MGAGRSRFENPSKVDIDLLKKGYSTSTESLHGCGDELLHSSSTGGGGVPLKILRDLSTQTSSDGYNSSKISTKEPTSKVAIWRKRFLICFAIYIAICGAVAYSSTVQSLLVYVHLMKLPRDPKDLRSLGVAAIARNIQFETADGLKLYGYHFFPPSELWPRLSQSSGQNCLPLVAGSTTLASRESEAHVAQFHSNTSSILSELASEMEVLSTKLPSRSRRGACRHGVTGGDIENGELSDLALDKSLANAERVIVYFHGNGLSRAFFHRINTVRLMAAALNAHVITFDYRGFGDSEGWPSEEGTHRDSQAVMKWINDRITRYNPNANVGYLPSCASGVFGVEQCTLPSKSELRSLPRLYFYGHSLGTGVATAIAQELSSQVPGVLSGLMLDSGFARLADAVRTHPLGAAFRILPVIQRFLESKLAFFYPSIDRLPDVRAPLLFVHGHLDYKVPLFNSEAMIRAAVDSRLYREVLPGECWNEDTSRKFREAMETAGSEVSPLPVQLVEIQDAKHSNAYKYPEWYRYVPKWVRMVETAEYC